jgi:fatty acid desaturase
MAVNRQPQLEDIAKSGLVDAAGLTYAGFRSSLRPAWPIVARDFVFGYVMLAASAALVVVAAGSFASLRVLWVAIGALLIGFWMAYIQLFLHEAAHFNLWPERRWNDRLANLLIGVWVATDIREYRRIHWDHHRFLGQPCDTERSYFSALGWRFLLESLFLVSAIRVIVFRRRKIQGRPAAVSPAAVSGNPMLAAAALAHALVLAACVWLGQIQLALVWLAGNLMVYPLFGALRQLLEHRDTAASAGVDYSTEPHGKLTRSFKAGPFGSFFGGAGFRWHDIHHFDPELSYTNLAQVDAFLQGCKAARGARCERKSYARVARELWRR